MMFTVSPETLFRRYLRSGSPADLAEVFDLVAPELLRMSRHLARDEAEAEDLVQAVFLAAIETRAQFDAKGKLTSWLVSILVNELRQTRRRERRMAGPAVPAQSVEGSAGPLEEAHATEVRVEVRLAVEGLPEPYREVINGLLMRHEEAREIADRLGRSGDTVRSQIRRGLTMLRRSLPMGLATGLAVMVTPVRGIAAIRRAVLSKAQVEPLVVAGLLTAKALLVLSLSLALVAGLFATASSWSGSERTQVSDTATPNAGELPADEPVDRPLVIEVARTIVTAPANATVGASPEDSKSGSRIEGGFSVRGHVRDVFGVGLGGAVVALIREGSDMSLFTGWSELPASLKSPYLEAWKKQERLGTWFAITDSAGRFSFRPATSARFELFLVYTSIPSDQVGPIRKTCRHLGAEGFYPGTRPPSFELSEAQRAVDVEIALIRSARVRVDVVGPEGNGIGGVMVRLIHQGSRLNVDLRTDPTGRCSSGRLVPGKYELQLFSSDSRLLRPRTESILDLLPGATKTIGPLTFRLGRGRVSGRVVDQHGVPFTRVKLMALREGEAWNSSQTAHTNSEGVFVLDHLPKEKLKIRLMGEQDVLDELAVFPKPREVDLTSVTEVQMSDWSVIRNIPHVLFVDLVVSDHGLVGKERRLRRDWIRCYRIPGTWGLKAIEAALASPGGLHGRFGSKVRLIKVRDTNPIRIESRSPHAPFTLLFLGPAQSLVRHVEPVEAGRQRIVVRF